MCCSNDMLGVLRRSRAVAASTTRFVFINQVVQGKHDQPALQTMSNMCLVAFDPTSDINRMNSFFTPETPVLIAPQWRLHCRFTGLCSNLGLDYSPLVCPPFTPFSRA